MLRRVMLSVTLPPSVSTRRPMATRMGRSYPEVHALHMLGTGVGETGMSVQEANSHRRTRSHRERQWMHGDWKGRCA